MRAAAGRAAVDRRQAALPSTPVDAEGLILACVDERRPIRRDRRVHRGFAEAHAFLSARRGVACERTRGSRKCAAAGGLLRRTALYRHGDACPLLASASDASGLERAIEELGHRIEQMW